MAVIKLAKEQNQWQIVSQWCDQLNPNNIDNQPMIVGDKKGKSKREQWFFAKVKSLIELQSWKEARFWALEAIKYYPKEINFHRWSALSLGYQGEINKAIDELNKIILQHREEWYLLQDLADLYLRLNQQDKAMYFYCRSALASGENRAKVTLFQNISQLSLDLGNIEMAIKNCQLSIAIRQQENWKIKNDLQALKDKIDQQLIKSDQNFDCANTSLTNLIKLCRKDWQKEVYKNLERQTGIIDYLPEDKSHGFILCDDGKSIFFLQKDLPKHLRKEKLKVSFSLEKTWDRKKNKESFKAVNFQS